MVTNINPNHLEYLNDGTMDLWEVLQFEQDYAKDFSSKTDLRYKKFGSSDLTWKQLIQKLKANAAKHAEIKDAKTPKDAAKLYKAIQKGDGKIIEIKKQLEELRKKTAKEKKGHLEKREKALKKQLKVEERRQRARIKLFDGLKSSLKKGLDKVSKKVRSNAGLESDKKNEASAKLTSNREATGPKAATISKKSGGKSDGNSGGSKAQSSDSSGIGKGFDWGAQTIGKYSTTDFQRAMGVEAAAMGTWNSIFEKQNEGEKLRQLLFYYMRMAASGDMMAWYQLLRFVTIMCTKAKAVENQMLVKKMIQLQDASQAATKKLMAFQTTGETVNQNDFTKQLQQTKAETDSIAMSMKILTQMMEEFAQVSETMTNMTQNALRSASMVMRAVSQRI